MLHDSGLLFYFFCIFMPVVMASVIFIKKPGNEGTFWHALLLLFYSVSAAYSGWIALSLNLPEASLQLGGEKGLGPFELAFKINETSAIWAFSVSALFFLHSLFFEYLPQVRGRNFQRSAVVLIGFSTSTVGLFAENVFLSLLLFEGTLLIMHLYNSLSFDDKEFSQESRYYINSRLLVFIAMLVAVFLTGYPEAGNTPALEIAILVYFGSFFLCKPAFGFWSQSVGLILLGLLLSNLAVRLNLLNTIELGAVSVYSLLFLALFNAVKSLLATKQIESFAQYSKAVLLSFLVISFQADIYNERLFSLVAICLAASLFSIKVSFLAKHKIVSPIALIFSHILIVGNPGFIVQNLVSQMFRDDIFVFSFLAAIFFILTAAAGGWIRHEKYDEINLDEGIMQKMRIFQPWFAVLVLFFSSELVCQGSLFGLRLLPDRSYFLFNYLRLDWLQQGPVFIVSYFFGTVTALLMGYFFQSSIFKTDETGSYDKKLFISSWALDGIPQRINNSFSIYIRDLSRIFWNYTVSFFEKFIGAMSSFASMVLERIFLHESTAVFFSLSYFARFILGFKVTHYFFTLLLFFMVMTIWVYAG